jgi:hypothetical protein
MESETGETRGQANRADWWTVYIGGGTIGDIDGWTLKKKTQSQGTGRYEVRGPACSGPINQATGKQFDGRQWDRQTGGMGDRQKIIKNDAFSYQVQSCVEG